MQRMEAVRSWKCSTVHLVYKCRIKQEEPTLLYHKILYLALMSMCLGMANAKLAGRNTDRMVMA